MQELKENFKVDKFDSDLQKIVRIAGEKLSWKPVSITNNEIEFQYTFHLTKFKTIVSWTEDGYINLSSNYMMKSVKVDMGNYRKGNNEKIKLSILRELSLINKISIPDVNNFDNNVNNLENNQKIETTQNPNYYSNQIKEKENSQKNTLIYITLLGVIFLLGFFIYSIFFKENTCGCNENDIVELQKSLLLTREKAIEKCCEFQKMADEMNQKLEKSRKENQ